MLPTHRAPLDSRGLIVANQQMDIGILNALELLTKVGATANPLCLGPNHLKESKPSRLVWAGLPLAGVLDCKIQVPEEVQLQDNTLNRGVGG